MKRIFNRIIIQFLCWTLFLLPGIQNNTINAEESILYKKVINDRLPELDRTPIPVLNGYIIQSNGKFGYLGLDGKIVFDVSYEQVMFTGRVTTIMPDFDACLFEKEDDENGDSVWAALNEKEYACTQFLGGWPSELMWAYDEQYGIYYSSSSYTYIDILEQYTVDNNDHAIFINHVVNGQTDDSRFYIMSSDKIHAFGPYTWQDLPTFSLLGSQYVNGTSSFYNYGNKNKKIEYLYGQMGLFFEKTEEGYFIWDNTGTKKTGPFDRAEPIFYDCMKVWDGENIGVIDKDLKLVLNGPFEDISMPIGQIDCIKENGQWKLVELNKKQLYPKNTYTIKKAEKNNNTFVAHFDMNIRKKPSFDGKKVRMIHKDESVMIPYVFKIEEDWWGILEDGNWICIQKENTPYLEKVS